MVALCVPLAAMLEAASHPGIDAEPFLLGATVVAIAAVGWLTWLFTWARRKNRRRGFWWIVAPIMVLAVAALVTLDVPVETRFAFARSDFDAAIENQDTSELVGPWSHLTAPGKVGSFEITELYQSGDAFLFFDSQGDFLFSGAGFAYLPNGPDGLSSTRHPIRDPNFRSLGGGWYWWTASTWTM